MTKSLSISQSQITTKGLKFVLNCSIVKSNLYLVSSRLNSESRHNNSPSLYDSLMHWNLILLISYHLHRVLSPHIGFLLAPESLISWAVATLTPVLPPGPGSGDWHQSVTGGAYHWSMLTILSSHWSEYYFGSTFEVKHTFVVVNHLYQQSRL